MSCKQHFERLAQYNLWMNKRLMDCAAGLDDAAWRAPRGAFFDSIMGTFNHLLVGDLVWLHRFATALETHKALANLPEQPQALSQILFDQFADFRLTRCQVDIQIVQFIHATSEAQLQRPLRYQNMAGKAHSKRLSDVLLHLFNHQTHHRGQLTTLLQQAGCELPDTDLILLMPEASIDG